jgi:hypothetical protein
VSSIYPDRTCAPAARVRTSRAGGIRNAEMEGFFARGTTALRADLGTALVGIVGRFCALFSGAGDDELAGLEAAFPGHRGQFVAQ